uniref:Uncharacterized protein n=1 Tax=Knipowitschia caucasica TaxID=637954 RepID=A0AAV2JKW6_KNICA
METGKLILLQLKKRETSSGTDTVEGGAGLRHLLQNYYYENESRLYAEAETHKNCTEPDTETSVCRRHHHSYHQQMQL